MACYQIAIRISRPPCTPATLWVRLRRPNDWFVIRTKVPRALVRAQVTSAGFALRATGRSCSPASQLKETVSALSGHQSPRSGAPTARGVFINSLSSSVQFYSEEKYIKKCDFVAAVGMSTSTPHWGLLDARCSCKPAYLWHLRVSPQRATATGCCASSTPLSRLRPRGEAALGGEPRQPSSRSCRGGFFKGAHLCYTECAIKCGAG